MKSEIRKIAIITRAAHGSPRRARMSSPSRDAHAFVLILLTHWLAAALRPDVRVNCISPGWSDVDEDAKLPKQDRLSGPRLGISELRLHSSIRKWQDL